MGWLAGYLFIHHGTILSLDGIDFCIVKQTVCILAIVQFVFIHFISITDSSEMQTLIT